MFIMEIKIDRVESKTIHAELEPKSSDIEEAVLDLDVMKVEIGLRD